MYLIGNSVYELEICFSEKGIHECNTNEVLETPLHSCCSQHFIRVAS